MISVLAFLACGPKHSSSEASFQWPTDTTLNYFVEFQQTGIFRASGSADLNGSLNFIFNLRCTAQPVEGRTQMMTCTVPAEVVSVGEGTEQFSGTIESKWKGRNLVSMETDGLSDSMTTVFKSALGALEFSDTPEVCNTSIQWKDKSAYNVFKIHGLNGPASYRNEYSMVECTDRMHIEMQSQISLSAMSTDNTSAPIFSFEGSDYLTIDPATKLILSREHSQILSNSTTALGAGMIKQSISVQRK